MVGPKALVLIALLAVGAFDLGDARSVEAPKVKVGMYYETLCGGCRAQVKDGEILCQHGEMECLGNTIQSCALHLFDFDKAFDFVVCMEHERTMPNVSAPECAKTHGMDYSRISECVTGGEGKVLLTKMGQKTESLDPKSKFVPWITVNGVHTDEIQKSAQMYMRKVVCDAYEGPKPEACLEKVEIAYYYQTVDEASKNTMGGQLYPAYSELENIMQIELVPFGNSSKDCKPEVDERCLYNAIHSCSAHLYDVDTAFAFVECSENENRPLNESTPYCAEINKVDYEKVMKCARGEEGQRLRREAAAKTEEQRAEFYPWMTINGMPIDLPKIVMGDLKRLVCNYYSGPMPDACKPNPIKVGFYYETLCPFCKTLLSEQIYPAYKNFSSIMELELIPYGNVFVKEGKAQCQHGEIECLGNAIQSCALHLYKFDQALDFVVCMEKDERMPNETAPECAKSNGMDYSAISSCANGEEGKMLQKQMGEKTEKLNPKHDYVPWITINGAHSDVIQEAAEDMKALICNLYMGPEPEMC